MGPAKKPRIEPVIEPAKAPPAASGASAAAAAPEEAPAASGALPANPPQMSFTKMLEMDSAQHQEPFLLQWASRNKEYVDKALLKFLNEQPETSRFPDPHFTATHSSVGD